MFGEAAPGPPPDKPGHTGNRNYQRPTMENSTLGSMTPNGNS